MASAAAAPTAAALHPPTTAVPRTGASQRSLTAQAQLLFESANLDEMLKREVLLHIACIPPAQAIDYSRSLLNFTLRPTARAYPFALHSGLLKDIIDAKSVDPVRTLYLAVGIVSAAATICDKSDLYLTLARLGEETPDGDAQILWALNLLPTFALRLEAIQHLPQWQKRLKIHLGTYLQCLEPLLPFMGSADFRHLNSWPAAYQEVPTEQDDSDGPPLVPLGLCALQDFDEDEVLERMELQADRLHQGFWQDLRQNDNENIMLAKRHFATHAAVGTLLAAYPLEPPTEALTPVIDLFLKQLAGDTHMQERYGVTNLDVIRAERSWSRPEIHSDSDPVNSTSMINYLSDHKMPSARFAALIWRSIQSFIDADKTWETSTASRSTMTTGFVKALARIQTPKLGVTYPDLPDHIDVETSRRCHVGVTQELLSGLAGFYPFSLDQVTPAELLSVLAENAFGGDAADTMPDMYQVLSFAEEARKRARDVLKEVPFSESEQTKSQSPKPDESLSAEDVEALKRRKTDIEIFDQLLEEYLAYDFDFKLPAMAQNRST